ncbi:MAG: hypothetical protein MJB14_20415, partial [Spirochaetes bacterium]|nr:hypothetical protein [Spirochaetota bacterium]
MVSIKPKIFYILPLFFFSLLNCFSHQLLFTPDEQSWLADNKNRVFTIGFDPFTGVDFFILQDKENGIIIE